MTTINVDRAWFKKNPRRNFRIRAGAPGEVEELFRRGWEAAGYELAKGASFDLGDDREYRVMIINAGPDTLLRMPVVRRKDAPDEVGADGEGSAAMTVVLGQRLVIDRIGG